MRPTSASLATAPDPIERPRLAHFLWARGLTFRDVATPLKRSHEYVRRLCLPFDDPKRVVPDDGDLALIAGFTDGEITRADFEGPEASAVARVLKFGRSS